MRQLRLLFTSMMVFTLLLGGLVTAKPAAAAAANNQSWIKSISVSKNSIPFGETFLININIELNEGDGYPVPKAGDYMGVYYLLPNLDENGEEVQHLVTVYYNETTKRFEGTQYNEFNYEQIGTWEVDRIVDQWAPLTVYNSNLNEGSDLSQDESLADLSAGNITLQTPNPGWFYFDNTWYYLNMDLEPVTGWLYYKSKWYYLDPEDGSMATGWVYDRNSWYYLDPLNGDMRTGWIKDGSRWYYFGSNGAMKTGWIKDGTKWYYLYGDGTMMTGWVTLGSTKYYLNSNGVMQVGWLKLGQNWYYFNSNGAMVTGYVTISGKINYFKGNGIWVK